MPKGSRLEAVKRAIRAAEKQFEEGGKASVGDFIRLVQLEKEMEEQEEARPKEIVVRWIDPPSKSGE